MAYERTNWQNEVTPIDADHLNNIEDGIKEAMETIEAGLDRAQERIHISTAEPTSADGQDGDIWIKYTV